MIKKSSRALILMLASTMLLLSACGETSNKKESELDQSVGNSEQIESSETESVGSEYPEYLNLDSEYPIIKDEYAGTVKPKLMVCFRDTAGDWAELWLPKYLKEKYNVEFDVEVVYTSALSERKSLMLNSGELPDIIMNCSVNVAEIVEYGVEQGMLLKCDEYINETLTPNLAKWLEKENVVDASTSIDGHIYGLPNIGAEKDPGSYDAKNFINTTWLKELNIEMPRTLDDFTAAMYAIKEADLAGVGSENVYPIGGGMDVTSPAKYLLNAFGYIYGDGYGTTAAYRDGEVVIPAYDMDVFQEYLKLMNQYYQDGIIAPDFFTVENVDNIARLTGGQTALYSYPVYTTGLENWDEWEACYPLTSDWQEEPQWAEPDYVGVGGLVISADTEYPELCMRICDLFYDEDICRTLWCGVPQGGEEEEEYSFGCAAYYLDEETQTVCFDIEASAEGLDNWNYHLNYLFGNVPGFGAINTNEAINEYASDCGAEDFANQFDLTNPDQFYRASITQNVVPYSVRAFASNVYLDEDIAQRRNELESVIEPYIKEQVALFITGGRPLSETEDFVKELQALGVDELLELYKQMYELD